MSDDVKFFGCGVVLLIAFVVGGVAVIAWVNNSLSIGPELARIEQLRHDAADVDPQQAEDVIGQVVETNQRIISTQAWNRNPLIGWTIPDEWDSVQLIPVPKVNQ